MASFPDHVFHTFVCSLAIHETMAIATAAIYM